MYIDYQDYLYGEIQLEFTSSLHFYMILSLFLYLVQLQVPSLSRFILFLEVLVHAIIALYIPQYKT
jgi:glucan phosphoethanolaminetransferase (alkaline phosphatase superfamily)